MKAILTKCFTSLKCLSHWTKSSSRNNKKNLCIVGKSMCYLHRVPFAVHIILKYTCKRCSTENSKVHFQRAAPSHLLQYLQTCALVLCIADQLSYTYLQAKQQKNSKTFAFHRNIVQFKNQTETIENLLLANHVIWRKTNIWLKVAYWQYSLWLSAADITSIMEHFLQEIKHLELHKHNLIPIDPLEKNFMQFCKVVNEDIYCSNSKTWCVTWICAVLKKRTHCILYFKLLH